MCPGRGSVYVSPQLETFDDTALACDALVEQGLLVGLKVGYQDFLLGYEAVGTSEIDLRPVDA